ncbi:MAG: zinc-finger domain-containing protein [Bacillota bacterium]|nr:zinc-finger domain-containing protein [Bacillota bacterium]
MKRKELIEDVESLIAEYCNGCFVHQAHKEEYGRRFAHRFCITQCTVGEMLKKYGEKLSGNKKG